jgi:DNA-binding XRE family transcriptional regulator
MSEMVDTNQNVSYSTYIKPQYVSGRKEEGHNMLTMENEKTKLTLVSWRKARGYTQEEMATLLGIPMVTYSRWEKRPEKIPVNKAIKAAEVLRVDFRDIIFLPNNDAKCRADSGEVLQCRD